jgi:hypothetical protein
MGVLQLLDADETTVLFDSTTQPARRTPEPSSTKLGAAVPPRGFHRTARCRVDSFPYETGHYRPRVSRSGYRANSNLDADDDGTACEVSL